ncbi:pancreatic lipase-related protein 2 [Hyalella azteca]|uniref:Pancreatic lipase-related protein 2 n=1 Tax=Hyalella azteca TaxID=294128 RepID=A0A8B7PL67_HYAAZ|nr:pancreatic lipase-related protein 2 [Hyalella azteca]XP_018026136.1 pancreatic lipase-related protein 2 [Hyalella azteca]
MATAETSVGVIFRMLFASYLLDTPKTDMNFKSISCQPDVSVCYDIYGQQEEFALTAPWSGTADRPMTLIPFSPAQLNTTFLLTSSPNQTLPLVLDLHNKTVLYKAPLNLDGKVYLITHGYRSNGSSSWAKLLTGELMRANSSNNVVVVNWSKGANVDYAQSVANIRVVARQLAFLINSLQVIQGIPSHSFHLIGHSLGAHVCGIAGTYLKQRYGTTIQRITGLDPAHPLHGAPELITRLDPSDAAFVDVIHTDNYAILGFPMTVGIMNPIGHLDFYPNGGGPQPGCIGEDIKCSHARAIQFFIESVRQECSFLAVRCPSHQMLLKGECWGCKPPHECSEMGLRTVPMDLPVNSKFFLLTHDSSPYCGHHYLVTITVSNSTVAADHDGEFGLLYLTLEGFSSTSNPISLTPTTEYYSAGSVHQYVVLASNVGQLRKVRITFRYPGPSFNPMSWRLQEPRLFLSKVTVQLLGAETSYEFCFDASEQRSGLEYVLTPNDICRCSASSNCSTTKLNVPLLNKTQSSFTDSVIF